MATRYEILNPEPVGQGGFGKVRLGHDRELDRKVAVKLLDPAWAAPNTEDEERFRREARVLAKLSHPNIPSIYDVLFEDGKLEIVFQFVEGTTLRKILEDGPVKLAECRIWFDQIASALGHAHENGIVHRDVKPENVVVSPDRKHCYLVDFGIALSKAERKRLTGSDDWIGTPGYMSPEQQNGEELDGSDDIYVLGVCLYEALSGQQIGQGDYRPLNLMNELIPPAIDDLIRKCIARKPQRLQDAAEFRRRMQLALSKHRTLSEVLSSGQLHEIIDTINGMTPPQFMELKAGQRLLILQKCQNLVNATDRKLATAREEFLENLTYLGIHLPADEYRKIIVPAFRLGFGSPAELDGSYMKGIRSIREAITDAARDVAVPNQHVIVEALSNWIGSINLEIQKPGLFHALRTVVSTLMANPECEDEDAPELATILARGDELQRAAGQEASPAEPDDNTERHRMRA